MTRTPIVLPESLTVDNRVNRVVASTDPATSALTTSVLVALNLVEQTSRTACLPCPGAADLCHGRCCEVSSCFLSNTVWNDDLLRSVSKHQGTGPFLSTFRDGPAASLDAANRPFITTTFSRAAYHPPESLCRACFRRCNRRHANRHLLYQNPYSNCSSGLLSFVSSA